MRGEGVEHAAEACCEQTAKLGVIEVAGSRRDVYLDHDPAHAATPRAVPAALRNQSMSAAFSADPRAFATVRCT